MHAYMFLKTDKQGKNFIYSCVRGEYAAIDQFSETCMCYYSEIQSIIIMLFCELRLSC